MSSIPRSESSISRSESLISRVEFLSSIPNSESSISRSESDQLDAVTVDSSSFNSSTVVIAYLKNHFTLEELSRAVLSKAPRTTS